MPPPSTKCEQGPSHAAHRDEEEEEVRTGRAFIFLRPPRRRAASLRWSHRRRRTRVRSLLALRRAGPLRHGSHEQRRATTMADSIGGPVAARRAL
ncbi:hypothetical protein MTO96_027016 [Rhipicephalus appendiculatus]